MKRIAFFSVGMIGGRGIPSLILLLHNLSAHYAITVYRLRPGDGLPAADPLRLRSVPRLPLPMRIRYMIIILRFIFDHLRQPYAIIYALSATPTGRIAVGLGKLFAIPVVIQLHAAEAVRFPSFHHGDLLTPRLRKITERVCRRAAALTVLSEYQKAIVTSNLAHHAAISVIPRGMDLSAFPFTPAMPSQQLRLLFVGYPEPVKDPEGAIDVFTRVLKQLNAHLTVVGPGLSKERFKLALEQGDIADRVDFRGAVSHEMLRQIYRTIDILLITSRYESQSAVALEAMATGVLVCGTNVGVLADVAGTCCVTVGVERYQDLADEIVSLWRDPQRQEKYRQHARTWTVDHDARWTVQQYEELTEKVIHRRP